MRKSLPRGLVDRFREWRRRSRQSRWPDLRRTTPVSRSFGFDRGKPIDRHYIEQFLADQSQLICGRVLEIGDSGYTRRFGQDRVLRSDVLHAVAGNSQATIVGDLASGAGIPRDAFDCIILTQTLPFIYDCRAAIRNVYAALNPGGAVLATMPCICQISRYDMDRWGDYWRFTDLSARKLFAEHFDESGIAVQTFGNVLTATAFLQGLATEDLTAAELAAHDPDYPMVVAVRAIRSKTS